MNFYDDLVMQTQMNYSRHYHIYASGGTPYQLTDKKPLPYSEQIHRLVQEVKEADCVVVGGTSGLSAAGGGDFYYEDNDSYRKYFRPFAEKYHFKGAFAGMMYPWKTREEYWGYLATFLHTTQTAPVRHPYLDLDALLKGKDSSSSPPTRIPSLSNSTRRRRWRKSREITGSSSVLPAAPMTPGMR